MDPIAGPTDGGASERIKAGYETRRRLQAAIAAVSVLVLSGMAALLFRGEAGSPWFTFGAMLVVALAVAALRNWRCPACGRYLGRKPRYGACPACGAAFR